MVGPQAETDVESSGVVGEGGERTSLGCVFRLVLYMASSAVQRSG